jgi:uncharacterized membrane protein
MILKVRDGQLAFWLVPLTYAVVSLFFGLTVPRFSYSLFPNFVSTISVNAAIGIYSAVASGMLALTGIVFSLAFVMVQFSATAYSPRLVPWVSRDPVISHAIGVFTATFLYAITALAWVDRNGSGRVPLIGIAIVTLLLIASVMMFIALIQRVAVLQITRMLLLVGHKGRRAIESVYLPIYEYRTQTSAQSVAWPHSQTLIHRGEPQVIRAINFVSLIDLAVKNECSIEVTAAVGDAVFDSTTILRVFSAGGLPEESFRLAIELGDENAVEQDPKYAIRLLVDIAIRALSPAVNDPTTAVQALDQIEDLLLRLGRSRLETGRFHDSPGVLRLVVPFPSWEDFLRLALDEIRYYGATSFQVMRRMKALVTELISILPEERSSALRMWQERIQSTVDHSFPDADDKRDASEEDLQGLGGSRRLTAMGSDRRELEG